MTERTCIFTKTTLDPSLMLRFVCDQEGKVYPDILGKLPGRGAWLRAEKIILEKAIKTKSFAKSFKRAVTADETLPDFVEKLLVKDAMNSLAMARKAGIVINGSTKLMKAAKEEALYLVLHKETSAEDSIKKIAKQLKIREAFNLPAVTCLIAFTEEDLAQVFGDQQVAHIGIFGHSLAKNFLYKANKLQFYRSGAIINIASAMKE